MRTGQASFPFHEFINKDWTGFIPGNVSTRTRQASFLEMYPQGLDRLHAWNCINKDWTGFIASTSTVQPLFL
jgi:hypothetical protein